uniref:Altered inheritance of mitochondria protein 6 n=1 Tax=Bionectria ochroleuca TaxID=29856 RepID=A0A8H7TSH1_BIOOC
MNRNEGILFFNHPIAGSRNSHLGFFVALRLLGSAIICIIFLSALIIKASPLLCPLICGRETLPDSPPSSPAAILPASCHSHNDYWRERPLFSALEAGCVGVEADVWPYKDELFVAHGLDTIVPNRTLKSMYLNPLLQQLDGTGRSPSSLPATTPRGLYKSRPTQTLVLLVDFKSHPEKTWSLLMRELEPLRRSMLLTSYVSNQKIIRPITVVVTGDIPAYLLNQDESAESRDVFLDAPLSNVQSGLYDAANSHWASMSLAKLVGSVSSSGFSSLQLAKIRSQVRSAHDHGLQVRFWKLPTWPIGLRNKIWASLREEGVDILNTDDLQNAANALREDATSQ